MSLLYNRTMSDKRVEIYKGVRGEIVFSVEPEAETIWATQRQMADAFGCSVDTISLHLKNIFREGELEENRTVEESSIVQIEGKRTVTRKVKLYNLDAIISVGYRVNSKKATRFRIWATNVLRRYVVDGAVINKKRIQELPSGKLNKLEDALGIVRRLIENNTLNADEANGVLEVISRYEKSFKILEEYDEHRISFGKSRKARRVLTIEKCYEAIAELRERTRATDLFGKPRDDSFSAGLESIYQTFDGKELYPTVSEKAANLIYFIIKDHPFYDGNKRIGAFLFLIFLTMNDVFLTENGETKISDRTLVAIALLIAESNPKEKDLMVALVRKLLD